MFTFDPNTSDFNPLGLTAFDVMGSVKITDLNKITQGLAALNLITYGPILFDLITFGLILFDLITVGLITVGLIAFGLNAFDKADFRVFIFRIEFCIGLILALLASTLLLWPNYI